MWKYTTLHGVECYFEPLVKPYLKYEVEKDTVEMFIRWEIWRKRSIVNPRHTLRGVICIFKKDKVFIHQQLGFKDRRAFGASGNNWIKVGTGGESIQNTAYVHEISHIHLDHLMERPVPEAEAHSIFQEVGV